MSEYLDRDVPFRYTSNCRQHFSIKVRRRSMCVDVVVGRGSNFGSKRRQERRSSSIRSAGGQLSSTSAVECYFYISTIASWITGSGWEAWTACCQCMADNPTGPGPEDRRARHSSRPASTRETTSPVGTVIPSRSLIAINSNLHSFVTYATIKHGMLRVEIF